MASQNNPGFLIRTILLCFLLLLQGCSTNVFKQPNPAGDESVSELQVITSEGQAVIARGAILQARRQAIQAAINNAAAQKGVNTTSRMLVSNTKVVDEWQRGDVYHVQILSMVSENQFCHSPYKKRVVATAFPLVTSGQISGNESQDLYSGIPREMMNQLMETGDFIGRNKTRTVLYSRPDMAPEIVPEDQYNGSSIINIATETGSQFVLSGVIRDFEVESTEYVRGAGILAQIKSAVRDVVARRGITLDVYVHDGYSGALLFQHRYSDSILGDVWIPAGYSVGSERFNATSAGNKINNIIQMASQDIRRVFGCYPFTARVVKVDDDQIVIAAGSQDKLKPGDTLIVYNSSLVTHGLGQSGTNKAPLGMLKISEVSPLYSTATLEVPVDIRKIRVGDWVKSW